MNHDVRKITHSTVNNIIIDRIGNTNIVDDSHSKNINI